MIRHLSALAFLPSNEIPEIFEEGTDDVVIWFENNDIVGRVREHLRNDAVIRNPPLFLPIVTRVVST